MLETLLLRQQKRLFVTQKQSAQSPVGTKESQEQTPSTFSDESSSLSSLASSSTASLFSQLSVTTDPRLGRVSFRPSWDEWIPSNDRPSYEEDSKERKQNEIATAIANLTPQDLIERLEKRYNLDGLDLTSAMFEFEVIRGYPVQFYKEGKKNSYSLRGDQYVSVLVKAVFPGEQIPRGFIMDLCFNLHSDSWLLEAEPVEKAVFEGMFLRELTGTQIVSYRNYLNMLEKGSIDEKQYLDFCRQAKESYNLELTEPAKLLFDKRFKLMPIEYGELSEQLAQYDRLAPIHLSSAASILLHKRAVTAGLEKEEVVDNAASVAVSNLDPDCPTSFRAS